VPLVKVGRPRHNRLPIKVSSSQLSKSLLVAGFAYVATRQLTTTTEFCHPHPSDTRVRRSDSAALDLTHVACGRLDGAGERSIDCLGCVQHRGSIVEEAGGQEGHLRW